MQRLPFDSPGDVVERAVKQAITRSCLAYNGRRPEVGRTTKWEFTGCHGCDVQEQWHCRAALMCFIACLLGHRFPGSTYYHHMPHAARYPGAHCGHLPGAGSRQLIVDSCMAARLYYMPYDLVEGRAF